MNPGGAQLNQGHGCGKGCARYNYRSQELRNVHGSEGAGEDHDGDDVQHDMSQHAGETTSIRPPAAVGLENSVDAAHGGSDGLLLLGRLDGGRTVRRLGSAGNRRDIFVQRDGLIRRRGFVLDNGEERVDELEAIIDDNNERNQDENVEQQDEQRQQLVVVARGRGSLPVATIILNSTLVKRVTDLSEHGERVECLRMRVRKKKSMEEYDSR